MGLQCMPCLLVVIWIGTIAVLVLVLGALVQGSGWRQLEFSC